MPPRIGLVTYAKEPRLTEDDRPLIEDFRALGADAAPVRWDDADTDWTRFDALVLRSCWDYHLRPAEFAAWLARVEGARVPLFNSAGVVRWNMHKGYLRDLADGGARIPETVWLEAGAPDSLVRLLGERGWSDAIVKPAISASATDTWRTSARAAAADEPRFRELTARSAVLVQRFMDEITTLGEWSLMFVDGAFSHSVLKRPGVGDFRVQEELGGTSVSTPAPAATIASAQAVTAEIPGEWLFARIDGVQRDDAFVLMEAECIEPLLFFGHRPEARRTLAAAVMQRCSF